MVHMQFRSVRQLDNHEDLSAPLEGVGWDAPGTKARLGDRLSQHMAALIECGEFGEGERLPAESDLAGRFGVSRPVIREALSRLRIMGVITSRKGSGSYVQRRPDRPADAAIGFGPLNSLAQVRKCYEFRVSIEGDAAYYAAQNRTAGILLTMRDALDRMKTAIAEIGGMNADIAFHLAVASASGNEFFEAVMRSMRTPLEFAVNLARSLTLTRPMEHMLIVQAEHVAIFEAIEAQDRDAACRAMRRHIQNACRRVFEGPNSNVPPAEGLADHRASLP
jgi:GntR family transcriptional regulator, transcriptional repressor for pyruvate dehydrogenase complex